MTMENATRRRRMPPMSLELIGVLEHRRALFESKFGRPPRRGEPLFFDPHAAEPTRMPMPVRGRVLADLAALVGLSDAQAAAVIDRW
ncbi:MAG: hypothetical protein NVV74_16895 [Magnetospirillum sp.]|nr:hypothetical protein [Magnetospirillum sp.]